MRAHKNKWPIIASAGETEASQDLLKEIGLIPIHAYTILDVYTINGFNPNFDEIENQSMNNGSSEREHGNIGEREEVNFNTLLKIRNFSTKDGWMGDWSKGSHVLNDDIKKEINYKEDDSFFYMNLKDFKHYFSKIKICKIFENYHYNYLNLTQYVDKYCLVKMTVKKNNDNVFNTTNNNIIHGFVKFMQIRNKRAFPPNVKFGIIRIIICRLLKDNKDPEENNNEYEVEYLNGKMGQERDIFEERNFEEGEYILMYIIL